VEEYLACGLWPLSEMFGVKVEMKESPLSKVVVLMPQVNTVIGTKESGAEFEARIRNATNLLVGKYNVAEYNAYQGLRHGRLNHVFELAEVLYLPRPEPFVRKCKPAAMAPAPPSRKAFGKHGRGRKSFLFGIQTFMQELTLAKPMKHSNKFVVKSSRLTVAEKATVVTVKIAGKETCFASAGGSGATRAPMCALDLFVLGSSASANEPTPREQPCKCPRKF
jgi:hypothetical protein